MSGMRVAICENCLIEPVHLTPEQAADLPTKTTPLLCARCKRMWLMISIGKLLLRRGTVTVHALYESGACGGAMLSTATGVGTITVTTKCPICEGTNMDH